MAVVTLPCPCCPTGSGSGSGSGSGDGPPDPVGPCCDWCDDNCPETLEATATVAACGLSCTKTLLGGCSLPCPTGEFEYQDDPAERTTVNGSCDPCPDLLGPSWLAATVCSIRLECAGGVALASATALVSWLNVPVTIVSCSPFYAYASIPVDCGLLGGGGEAIGPCAACHNQTLFVEFTE
jgi:hypothetical protein